MAKAEFGVGERVILPHSSGKIQAVIVQVSGGVNVGHSCILRFFTDEGDPKDQCWPEDIVRQANPPRTIATIFKASRQILDDAPALRSYIDARARYGKRLKRKARVAARKSKSKRRK